MMQRLLGPSWRTTLSGYLISICGSTGIADEINPFLPDRVRYGLHAFCLLSVTFGFIAAKDARAIQTPAPAPAVTEQQHKP